LLFSFNYVYSHFLDDQDSSGWGSRGGTQVWQLNTPSSNYGNSNFDIPQAVKGYVSYDLPFGNGKRFANSVSKPVDAAIGGWRVAGTMVTQSGNPFTVVTSVNKSYTGCSGCSLYPNLNGNPRSSPGAGPGGGQIQWLNTSVYSQPDPGTLGDAGRNDVFGPRLTVFNMSLAKQFAFTERVHLELRSDWVNIFNHPSFGPPANTYGGGLFGVIGPSAPNGGITVAPRSGQLSAKITF
jgi:hypothetical protein